jgi:hypothetical protein
MIVKAAASGYSRNGKKNSQKVVQDYKLLIGSLQEVSVGG